MNRREFIKSFGLAGAATALLPESINVAQVDPSKKLVIIIEQRIPMSALEQVRELFAAAGLHGIVLNVGPVRVIDADKVEEVQFLA